MEHAAPHNVSFFSSWTRKLAARISDWLLEEEANLNTPLQDFSKMCEALKPADVLLFEGRARVSRAISIISQSQWTHAALYIGRPSDFAKDAEMQALIARYFDGSSDEPLLVESLLGKGMVITPLTSYAHEHIRLCRPHGILESDAKEVVRFSMRQVGRNYDVRQLFDLARFVFPYAILPRRWLSSLFHYKVGANTKAVCSTVLAEAFESVKFPILPVVRKVDKAISIIKRNPRLFTPRDFDTSPYFEVLKFPYVDYEQTFWGMSRNGGYRELPWEADESLYCNDGNECYIIEAPPYVQSSSMQEKSK